MPDEKSIARQEEADREYLRACREHGVEPVLPNYRGEGTPDDIIELHANQQDAASRNGSPYLIHREEPQPLPELSPEAEGAQVLLDHLLAGCLDAKPSTFVQSAGRRLLVLSWLLGRRREPLAELGRALNCSRASLSTMARKLENRLGIHGRGQKRSETVATYADNARKSWKLRRLNAALAEAAAEQ